METDKKIFIKLKNEIVTIKEIKIDFRNFKKIFYIIITLIILINIIIFSFTYIINKKAPNNLYKNKNIQYLIENIKKSIQNEISYNYIDCALVKNNFNNRIHPFDFENELIFFNIFNFL